MDFGRMFQTWINVLTKPSEETFEGERGQPGATLSTALIWMAIAGVIAAVFGGIGAGIQGLMGGIGGLGTFLEMLPPEVADQYGPLLAQQAGFSLATIAGTFCFTLIAVPIAFLIGSGIWFVIAKLFGGTGEFEEQSYLLATISAPMTIINGVLAIIPFVGACLSLLIVIYQLVLTYFAMKVSHNLTSGRALGVVLTPVVIALICGVCLFGTAFLGVMGALMGESNF
jgi:hypothetical protein